MKLVIGHFYPELLNLYGDRGNPQCLRMRLRWRGIQAQVISLEAGEAVDFDRLDLIVMGGGSDREQELACRFMKKIKGEFCRYVEAGGTVLAVCGGYQLLGEYYQTKTKKLPGLGVLGIHTTQEPGRLVGDSILKSPLCSAPIVGFENHGGRTWIGDYEPLGRVCQGYGNTGAGGFEGIHYKNLIGTYLHGPLLPKNPQLCDLLLQKALRQKYGGAPKLAPLPDELEHLASREMVRRRGRRLMK